ncbi:fluoride efflux transporter FluC [Nitrospira sp.]|uniref:fluoride efflux transporter FluC n=2 Tax=unclassified Nitrospira TaxID=2652172 RepID=UPI003FCDC6E4
MRGSDLMLASLGGGIGSLARWLVGLAVGRRYRGTFPVATFLLNISGAFLIGFLAVLLDFGWTERFGHPFNTFILTGFLAGYTTFSAMVLDMSKLHHAQQTSLALMYMVGTVVLAFLAAFFGAALASLFL